MLTPERKRELLESARLLSGDMRTAGAGRSIWRYAEETLFRSTGADRKAAQQLIDSLPDTWLKERSGVTASQLSTLKATFRRLLALAKSDAELRFLVGWTDRFLHLREKHVVVPKIPVKRAGGTG